MNDDRSTLALSVDFALEPSAAFDLLVEALADSLARAGLSIEPGPHGRVVENDFEVGRVVAWRPGEQLSREP